MVEISFSFIVTFVFYGLIFGVLFFYLFWCAIARKFLKADLYVLSLYMSTAFLVAVLTEPFHDMFYKFIFGEYLWVYQVLPVFDGGSTALAPVSWPFYGYYSYFLHQTLIHYNIKPKTWVKGLFPGIDGIPFDILANYFFLTVSGIMFFYYPRDEFGHMSSWWVIPFYTISGLIYAYSLDKVITYKKSWEIPLFIYLGGVICMVLGESLYRYFT